MKYLQALKSRTVWTIIVSIIINGVPSVRESIPYSIMPLIDAVLGLLAIYFRITPKTKF